MIYIGTMTHPTGQLTMCKLLLCTEQNPTAHARRTVNLVLRRKPGWVVGECCAPEILYINTINTQLLSYTRRVYILYITVCFLFLFTVKLPLSCYLKDQHHTMLSVATAWLMCINRLVVYSCKSIDRECLYVYVCV